VFSGLDSVSQVVAIDGRSEIRAAMAAQYPTSLQRADLGQALDEVDAVVVATPPETHADLAIEAMSAGKHVLVEKPMATSTEEARRMVRAAEAAGVTLVAGHTFAHNAAVKTLATLTQRGDLGQIHFIDAARLSLGLYRPDVNVLWDLAAHDISIATALLGTAPDSVSAWGSRHTDGYGEDVASLRMWFESEAVEATVRASWLDPVKVRRTTVVGSEKMAVYDDVDVDARIRLFDMGRNLSVGAGGRAPEVDYRNGSSSVPPIDFVEPLQVQAEDFINSALTGDRPVVDGHAGLAVVAVLEASDRSLQQNGAPVATDKTELRLRPRLAVA
jgi:predicted dehydrogenase